MPYVNAKEMLSDAKKNHYAVGHFNLNNMESVRAFLLAAEEKRSPIILGVSGGTAKYMGGYKTIADMVRDFMDYLKITVPVCTHVDHGTYEEALAAIEGGFSSVMFDGSKYPIEENIEKTRQIIALAHAKGITVEAEVGAIGGEEDGRIAMGECADPDQCRRIAGLGIDFLAAGIGNIHGKYPKNWPGLRFDVLIIDDKGDLHILRGAIADEHVEFPFHVSDDALVHFHPADADGQQVVDALAHVQQAHGIADTVAAGQLDAAMGDRDNGTHEVQHDQLIDTVDKE